ncbi:MAG: hypothetical protein M3460_21320, partial [Actinomycetota bacterium]|nr:hypothetical protein [Actinomycetota bacterium]
EAGPRMPTMWSLANPKIGEREVVAALPEHNHHLIRTDQILQAYKGFAGQGLKRHPDAIALRQPVRPNTAENTPTSTVSHPL